MEMFLMPKTSTIFTALTLTAAATLSYLAHAAETPNIRVGQWEYTVTTTLTGAPVSIPPRTDTNTQCLTEEDLNKPLFVMDDMQDCEISDQQSSSSQMSYVMSCAVPEAGEMRMNVNLQFNGDEMSGTMTGTMQSPVGDMNMTMTHSGKRIGDC
jgi:hypothetical protein